MDTLIIGNQSRREIRERIAAAWKTGKAEPAARVDFPDTSIAWKVLSDNRRAIIQAMAGQGALSIREIAAHVGRDVHAVHRDVRTLHHAGVINRTDDGWILPYRTIKLELVIEAGKAA
jgi:predicted transcriptional regulator